MSSLPKYGVFSTDTLMLDSFGARVGGDALVKRMAILFDRLVFFPIGLGPVGTPGGIFTKEQILQRWVSNDKVALAELGKIVSLDYELIEDIDAFYDKLLYQKQDDLWSGDSSQPFIQFCKNYVDEHYPDETERGRWDLYKAHIGCINSDFRLCQIVNRDFDNCSALITELHEKAVLETLARKTENTAEKVSTIVGDLNSIDFGSLTWSEIFVLRKSKFVDDYRKKVSEWAVAYQDSNHQELASKLESFIHNGVLELTSATEPNLRETVLSGIGSNLPLPIPVNPISVFCAIRDVVRAHKLKNKFGWFYFVNRSRVASQRMAAEK